MTVTANEAAMMITIVNEVLREMLRMEVAPFRSLEPPLQRPVGGGH
jgi:hypothetical protein